MKPRVKGIMDVSLEDPAFAAEVEKQIEIDQAELSCDCGPRKSCLICTGNPNPICPCGAWYNSTCYCTWAQREAFRAGREFEKTKT